jgi:hypothetical protein
MSVQIKGDKREPFGCCEFRVQLVDLFWVMACVAVCKQPDAKAEISVHVARMNGNFKKMRGPVQKTGGVAVVCRR